MKLTEIQTSKPAAKSKNSSRGGSGQPQPRSQTWGLPTQEQIAAQAYQFYVDSGWQEGRDLENWLSAEQLLKERSAGDAASSRAALDGNGNGNGNGDRGRQSRAG
jgi:hypothetical protein